MARHAGGVGVAGRALAWLGGGAFLASLAYFFFCYFVTFGRVTQPTPGGPQDVLPPLAANLALFTGFALHHSVMARSGAKRWLSRRVPPALERSTYVWVSSALFALTCAAWQEVPGVAWRVDAPTKLVLHVVQLGGAWLTFRSAGVIDIWELSGIRQAEGPARPPRFKVIGPYNVVRHPIYLAWALMTFGAPVMTGTRLSFALISTLYLAVAIPLEERSLVEAFGDEYREYQRRVRWRMVPGIY